MTPQVNFKVCGGTGHITCDWCGGRPLSKQGKRIDEPVEESEKWEAHAYFRLKTEHATCPAWLPSFPRNYSNKYEYVLCRVYSVNYPGLLEFTILHLAALRAIYRRILQCIHYCYFHRFRLFKHGNQPLPPIIRRLLSHQHQDFELRDADSEACATVWEWCV